MIRPLLTAAFFSLGAIAWADDAKNVTYQDEVLPIFRQHCLVCHNQDDPASDLALDSFEGVMAGGAGGEILAAGDLGSSRLWKLVAHLEEPSMPPENKMPDADLEIVRKWILGGLLEHKGSKPIKNSSTSVAMTLTHDANLPTVQVVLPEQLYREPVVWSSVVGPVDVLATSRVAPLVAIGWQRQVSFYNTATHQLLGILPYVEGTPQVIRFSRDGRLVLVAGGRHAAHGNALLFDLETGAIIATLGDELDIVLAADLSPDSSLVAIGGPKKKVRVYRTSDGSLAYTLGKHTDWITAIAFSPDGEHLATADRSAGVRLWQAAAGNERADLRGHTAAISALAWRADSQLLVSASEDSTVRLWGPDGKAMKSFQAHAGGVASVRFSGSGHFVTCGRDKKVKSWKSDGSLLAELGTMPEAALVAEYSHDDKLVVASDFSGMVQLFNATDGTVVAQLAANPPPLEQLLATLTLSVEHVTAEIQNTDQQLAAASKTLEEGQLAHQIFDAKFAETQQQLATATQARDQFVAQREIASKLVVDTQIAAEQAATALLAATTTAEPSDDSNSNQATEPEGISTEGLMQHAEAAQQKAQSLDHAVDALHEVDASVDKANQQFATVKQAAETHQNTRKQLPKIDLLIAEFKRLEQLVAKLRKTLASQKQDLAGTVASRKSFLQAEAELTGKQANFKIEQQTSSKALEEQRSTQQQLAGELAARRAASAQVEKQLTLLQEELQTVQAAEQSARKALDEQEQQLAKVQSQHSADLRQAQLAAARLQGFVAAQKLREKKASKE